MRFHIFGDSPIVPTLKEQFLKEGYIVTEYFPQFFFELIKGYREEPGGKIIDGKIKIFSCAGDLERHVLHRLCELTKEPLLLHRGESQFGIQIAVPQREEYNITHAVLRAANELAHVKIN